MPSPARFLQTSGYFKAAEPPAMDSDVVVILAALLCALICVVGLVLVARCAWLRRYVPSGPPPPPPPAASKGLKKKALQSLPKVSFDGSGGGLADCAICLAEFAEGDEIRILPQCGHVFHVGCVDTWLGAHSSCPSCRRVLVVPPPPPRCRMCGASSGDTSAAAAEGGAKAREDGDANRFLP